MADRFYGYQYDTNPRKLSPENTQIRNRYSRNGNNSSEFEIKTTNVRKKKNIIEEEQEDPYLFEKNKLERTKKKVAKENVLQSENERRLEKKRKIITNENTQQAKKTKTNIKPKLKVVMLLIAGFSVLFAISYQNSLINESFNKKEQYKKEAEALSKTNQQMEVNIENSLNLKNVEQVAKEKLGMQKLSNNQKIYVKLPKVDYVAPASEQVIIEEETGFFKKIVKTFSKSIN